MVMEGNEAVERGFAVETSLTGVLDLERLDRDLFRGSHDVDARHRFSLFGGQVAAQALMAAGSTVADDRYPHSLHGYFLRPGRPDRAVLLQVDRDRDGRSFSARHVAAIQEGEVIFSMLASFHIDETSGTFDGVPKDLAPLPDDADAARWSQLLDIREVTPTRRDGDDTAFTDCLWIRCAQPLPDDRLVQAAALTYISDLGTGFGQVHVPGLAPGGPSIDHAVWLHAPVRADRWLQLRMWPVKARGGRGVYMGAIRNEHGELAATLAQEMLLRQMPSQ
jgi:acyl-CoA thioesterase-2